MNFTRLLFCICLILSETVLCFSQKVEITFKEGSTLDYAILHNKLRKSVILYSNGINEDFLKSNVNTVLLGIRYLNNKGYDLLSGAGDDLVFYKQKDLIIKDSLKYDYVQLFEDNTISGARFNKPNLTEKTKRIYVQYFDWRMQLPDSLTHIFGNSDESICLFSAFDYFNKQGYSLVTIYSGGNADQWFYIFRRKAK